MTTNHSTLQNEKAEKNRLIKSIQKFLNYAHKIWPVILAAFLWSTSFVVTKEGVNEIPPLTFGTIRFLIASFILLGVAFVTRKVEKVKGSDLARLAVGGLLGFTAYFSFQNLGAQRTSASEATLLVASCPAITLVFERLIYKKKSSWIRYAGIVVALLGIYLVIKPSETNLNSSRLLGDLFLIITGLVWTFYNFVTQDVVQHYSPLTVIFWQTLFGTLFFIPLSFFEMGSWSAISVNGIIGTIYLAVFCSIFAFMLYSLGLTRIDSTTAVSLLNLTPIFGLIIAALTLQERIGFIQILGGLIVILGVMLTIPRKKHQV